MKPEQILAETFADHEHLAPDPDATWAGIADRLDGRRRPPGRSPGRTLAVTASAAAVVALALGGAVVFRDRPTVQVAAPRPPATTAPTTTPTPPAGFVPVTLIAAGWLPAGRVEQVLASVGPGEARGYLVAGIYVLLSVQPGTVLPATNKRGTPHDLTVAGRPAREWSVDDWYTMAIKVPGRGIATVDLSAEGRPAADLATIGRKVAATLKLNELQQIPVTYRLTATPPGTRVVSAGWDSSAGTRYQVDRPDAPPYPTELSGIDVSETEGTWKTSGQYAKGRRDATPGEPVNGHRTWVLRDPGATTLWVEGVRPGRSVVLIGDRKTTLADLYRVADGLVVTG